MIVSPEKWLISKVRSGSRDVHGRLGATLELCYGLVRGGGEVVYLNPAFMRMTLILAPVKSVENAADIFRGWH